MLGHGSAFEYARCLPYFRAHFPGKQGKIHITECREKFTHDIARIAWSSVDEIGCSLLEPMVVYLDTRESVGTLVTQFVYCITAPVFRLMGRHAMCG